MCARVRSGAGPLGRGVEQRQHVLQLVAVAERAARLVEAGAPEDARRDGLVEQPAVEHQVHGRLRRLDPHAPEQPVPERLQAGKGFVDRRGRAVARDGLQRLGAAGGLQAARRLRRREPGVAACEASEALLDAEALDLHPSSVHRCRPRLVHGEHRAGGMADHGFSDRPKHGPPDPGAAVRAEDNQIESLLAGDLHDLIGRLS